MVTSINEVPDVWLAGASEAALRDTAPLVGEAAPHVDPLFLFFLAREMAMPSVPVDWLLGVADCLRAMAEDEAVFCGRLWLVAELRALADVVSGPVTVCVEDAVSGGQ